MRPRLAITIPVTIALLATSVLSSSYTSWGRQPLFYRSINLNSIAQPSQGVSVSEAWRAEYTAPGTDQYGRAANGRAEHVAADGQGSVFVTGWSQDFRPEFASSPEPIATIKYDSSGHQQWMSRYGGAGQFDGYTVGIGVDANGNAYVAGALYEANSSNRHGIFVLKYRPNGTLEWATSLADGSDARDMALDDQGDVYVLGTGALFKFDSQGALQWRVFAHGDRDYPEVVDTPVVRVAPTGVYVGVNVLQPAPYGNYSALWIKYLTDGSEEWTRHAFSRDYGFGVTQLTAAALLPSGGIVGIAHAEFQRCCYNDAGNSSTLVEALDSTGTSKWNDAMAPSLPYTQSPDVSPAGVAVDSTNAAFVAANERGNPSRLIKYSASGVVEWTHADATYGYDAPQQNKLGMTADSIGTLYVVGSSRAYGDPCPRKLMKYGPEGTLIWAICLPTMDFPQASLEQNGDIALAGGGPTGYQTVEYRQNAAPLDPARSIVYVAPGHPAVGCPGTAQITVALVGTDGNPYTQRALVDVTSDRGPTDTISGAPAMTSGNFALFAICSPTLGTATISASVNGIALPATATFTFSPPPPPETKRVVVLIQGMNSETDCTNRRFETDTQWIPNLLNGGLSGAPWIARAAGLSNSSAFNLAYYGYFSDNNAFPYCTDPSGTPLYHNSDTCWTIDDQMVDGKLVTGQATQFASFINEIIRKQGPQVQIDILAHSQGATIALYAYNEGLLDTGRINSIISFDGVDGGLDSLQENLVALANRPPLGCGHAFPFEGNYDSASDMSRGSLVSSASAVTQCILQTACPRRHVPLFAMDTQPGGAAGCLNFFGVGGLPKEVNYPGYGDYLAIGGECHGDPWIGERTIPLGGRSASVEKQRLQLYLGCAISNAFGDCETLVGQSQFDVIKPYQQVARVVAVGQNSAKLTIIVQWPGSRVDSTLVSPSGIRYTTNDVGVIRVDSATSREWIVESPEAGNWNVELVGTDVAPLGEDVSIATHVEAATATPTNTPTSTVTTTPTQTPTPSPTLTSTPTATPSATYTPTVTLTFTPTATNTLTPTRTASNTATATNTPTVTQTATEAPTLTSTATRTPSATISPSPTPSLTPSVTGTPTNVEVSPTRTRTAIPSPTEPASDHCMTLRQKFTMVIGVLSHLGSHIGQASYALRFDANHDGLIDLRDLVAIIRRPNCGHRRDHD